MWRLSPGRASAISGASNSARPAPRRARPICRALPRSKADANVGALEMGTRSNARQAENRGSGLRLGLHRVRGHHRPIGANQPGLCRGRGNRRRSATWPRYDGREPAGSYGRRSADLGAANLGLTSLSCERVLSSAGLGLAHHDGRGRRRPSEDRRNLHLRRTQPGSHRSNSTLRFGLRPSAGVYFRLREFLGDNNEVRLHAATAASTTTPSPSRRLAQPDQDWQINLRAEYTHRPDGCLGIGLEADDKLESRSNGHLRMPKWQCLRLLARERVQGLRRRPQRGVRRRCLLR